MVMEYVHADLAHFLFLLSSINNFRLTLYYDNTSYYTKYNTFYNSS